MSPDLLPSLLQALLAPVVLISACGLLVLSTSARQTFLLTRVRTLHRERIDAFLEDPATLSAKQLAVRSLKLREIDAQTDQLLSRLRLTRNAMLFLYATVVLMVMSAILHGVALLAPVIDYAAIALFILGMLSTAAAMFVSFLEIARSLEAIRSEHEAIAALDAGGPHANRDR